MTDQNSTEKPMRIEVEGFEAIEKIVMSGGNSGRVYLPIDWLNCRVKIIRIEPIKENIKKK